MKGSTCIMNAINGSFNSICGRTALATGIGAGVGAVFNYANQKIMLKKSYQIQQNPNILFLLSSPHEQKKMAEMYLKYLHQGCKISRKCIGKASAVGAAACGALYLTYRGLKALLTPKQ